MIESWMISLGGMFVALIGTAYITRYQVSEIRKSQTDQWTRLDRHGDDIIRLKTKAELSVTAKDVDDKYVSKEYFRQHQKHMDDRFDHMDRRFDSVVIGQGKILDHIKTINKEK